MNEEQVSIYNLNDFSDEDVLKDITSNSSNLLFESVIDTTDENLVDILKKRLFKMNIELYKYYNSRVLEYCNKENKSQIQFKLNQLHPENFTYDDMGNGKIFAEVYKDTARFDLIADEWRYYNDTVWIIDTGSMNVSNLAKKLKDELTLYSVTLDEHVKLQYQSHIIKLGKRQNREIMIKDARDIYCFKTSDLDNNKYLLNCLNGTLNLITFDFLPHSANNLMSKVINAEYIPGIRSNVFENFINEILENDVEKIKYLKKSLGYALTGDTSLETCFILYGKSTRNGKSTLTETYNYLLGNYSIQAPPEILSLKKNKDSRQASGDIARLDGCRFLSVSEPSSDMIFDVALLKTLLGNDTITARYIYGREFQFKPQFKLFINTNHLPLITDNTVFRSNRINVISFNRHFNPDEQNKNLKSILRESCNLSGLLNWCIDGLKLYYEEGLKPPECIIEDTLKYEKNSNKIDIFLNECLVDDKINLTVKTVYDAYEKWCKYNKLGSENLKKFKELLIEKKLIKKSGKVNGVTYKDVVYGKKVISVH